LAGVQLVPATHSAQMPCEHTFPMPHKVPFGRLPLSVQADTPVAQELTPDLQGLATWQLVPAAQAEHVPALHTLSTPHAVPLATETPVSTQPIEGEHTVAPTWHEFVGTHDTPSLQGMHAPPLHTESDRHLTPSGALPDSMQTGSPVLQAVLPIRHGLPATMQLDPAAQATQLPVELQTMFLPQATPVPVRVPVSRQAGIAGAQSSPPTWQGSVGEHASPLTQGLQSPS
jgi:hypothetical protein